MYIGVLQILSGGVIFFFSSCNDGWAAFCLYSVLHLQLFGVLGVSVQLISGMFLCLQSNA